MVIAPHDHDMGSTTERAATPSYVGHPAMPDGYKINIDVRGLGIPYANHLPEQH